MYVSTRNNYPAVTAAEAIALGMVPTGGLFVPERLPQIDLETLQGKVGQSYQAVAEWILSYYLEDYTAEDIHQCVSGAYHAVSFPEKDVTPLVKLTDQLYVLELWHGPTAAFKDMALQLTPRLLVKAIEKMQMDKEVVILVATSGDTGKAALEGFKNVPGTRIIVFYPAGGVSKVQELQMLTTDGQNTDVVAVAGNFDDCQSAVKAIFSDQGLHDELAQAGFQFSSANSINWGRLLPQIVYYFASYLNLVRDGRIALGDAVDFVVPTGNFGNILAGWYAEKMGLPVGKLICASNENKVLTDFFQTGVYDRRRDFVQTNSPSMDILISSNLERFLYGVTGGNGNQVAQWMADLESQGFFSVDAATKAELDRFIVGGFATEVETQETIKTCFEQYGYLLDTHTAVALKVCGDYQAQSGTQRVAVIDSTASPYKFVASVYQAVTGKSAQGQDELELLEALSALSETPIHRGLCQLGEKPILHQRSCTKNAMTEQVRAILNLS